MQRISGDDRTCVAFTLVVIPVRLSIPACALLVLRSLFTVIAERGETEPPNHSARHKTSMLAAPGYLFPGIGIQATAVILAFETSLII